MKASPREQRDAAIARLRAAEERRKAIPREAAPSRLAPTNTEETTIIGWRDLPRDAARPDYKPDNFNARVLWRQPYLI
jgi:hypothetical protein